MLSNHFYCYRSNKWGASGFNVRGGGADQNLILLDEATIFNSSHVLVFLRFNDAIKDLKLQRRYSS
jgi:hypothetical protein